MIHLLQLTEKYLNEDYKAKFHLRSLVILFVNIAQDNYSSEELAIKSLKLVLQITI